MTVFSRAIAFLPKYGSLKFIGHFLGLCLIDFFNVEIALLIVSLMMYDRYPRAQRILLIF